MPAAAPPQLQADPADPATLKIRFAAGVAGVKLAVKAAPAGSIPELRRGELCVRYTGAILRHIGQCNEDSLLCGSSFTESGQVDSWLEWAEFEFAHETPPLLELAIEHLERHLEGRTYLVGQRLTLADVSVSVSLLACQRQGMAPAQNMPKAVQRWLGTCSHHEAFPKEAAAAAATARSAAAAPAAAAAAPAVSASAAPKDEPLLAKYSSCVGNRVRIARILRSADGGKSLIGTKVSVCGWVKTQRSGAKGALAFVELGDGSCVAGLQVVIDGKAKGFESLKDSGTGASLKCTGVLVESPGKGQAVELLVKEEDHEVVLFGGTNAKEYPLAKKEHGLEFLRNMAHLRPRTNIIAAVARVRSALAFATHEFFRTRGFQYIHTPLITAADCEGAGEMFQVTTMLGEAEKTGLPKGADGKIDYSKDFFGKPSFLTVSGQLSVENYCCALSNVYTFGPTFRAENSHTSRHLAEFWMIEPELAFADIRDDMDCAEDYLKYCVKYVYDNHMEELEFFDKKVEEGLIKRLENILKQPFARVTYTEAVDILIKESPKAKFQVPVEWGIDLGSEHERYLTEKVKKMPTIVYNYPKDIKAFYMRLNDDNKTVAAMDLLVPQIGEVIGGSQREERLDVLDRRIEEMGLETKDYWWYRDLRKYGSVPHSGFGLGFERLIMLCTGVENIRDVIPYPRYPGHAEF